MIAITELSHYMEIRKIKKYKDIFKNMCVGGYGEKFKPMTYIDFGINVPKKRIIKQLNLIKERLKMENKTEEWEAQAWEELRKADEKTLKNLKDNEALFDNMVYYTRPKNEVEELTAIVSIDSDTKIINILWTESDEELIEDYIESKIDKIPAGTFFIKFWGFDERTSYEYDEWDFTTSVNYEIEKYSDLNFEKTLKRYAEYEKVLKDIEQMAYRQCVCYDENDFLGIDLLISKIRDRISEVMNG